MEPHPQHKNHSSPLPSLHFFHKFFSGKNIRMCNLLTRRDLHSLISIAPLHLQISIFIQIKIHTRFISHIDPTWTDYS